MKRILFAFAVLALLLPACAPLAMSKDAPDEYPMVGFAPEAAPEERGIFPEPAAPPADYAGTPLGSQVPAQERVVIENADLAVVVPDPEARMAEVARMAREMGGFVVSSNLYRTTARTGVVVPGATIVIRVPAARLDEALEQIKADAVEVQNENRSGQDVTQQYVDLQSRLKNLEAAEVQLLRIIEQAEKTEDVLAVFNQLTYYREQIEVVKGQIRFYEESAALSAISVRIIAEETIKPLEIGGWKPQGVARDAVQALINFLQGFVNFLIWLVIFIVPMLAIALAPFYLVFLGIRGVVRKTRARKTPPEKS
jgi:hypothetical protein